MRSRTVSQGIHVSERGAWEVLFPSPSCRRLPRGPSGSVGAGGTSLGSHTLERRDHPGSPGSSFSARIGVPIRAPGSRLQHQRLLVCSRLQNLLTGTRHLLGCCPSTPGRACGDRG